MTIEQVQAHFRDKIRADAQLGLLSDPIMYSLLDNDDAVGDAIKAALETHGVCFVIDPPYCDSATTSAHGGAMLNLVVLLKVAESPRVAHSPAGESLTSAIIRTLIARSSPRSEPIAIGSYDQDVDENGYVLRVFEFQVSGITP
jgi:hypothetical protein